MAVFCSSSPTQDKVLVCVMARPICAFMSSMSSSICWWLCWSPARKTPGRGGGAGPSPPCMGGYLASAEGLERREQEGQKVVMAEEVVVAEEGGC